MIKAIWAVNDGEKVLRDDLHNANKQANSVWDGQRVKLRVARNEVAAFQMIVESGAEGVHGLQVDVPEFVHAEDPSCRIANGEDAFADPNGYVERYIEVFTEHYIYVPPELTTPPQWFYAEGAPPIHPSGWIPDALIPHDARAGFGGQPVKVLPFSNQGFWVDVYVSDGEGVKPGLYHGEVKVSAAGERVATIAVELEVLAFALPHENHSHTMVYASDVADDYFKDVDHPRDALRKMAHRHRFDLIGSDVHGKPFDSDALERYAPYLNGEFYSPENGYAGPGVGVGERIFPVGMYGSPVLGETPEEMQREADKWVSWFKEREWAGQYFLYLIDEPRPDKFEWINEQSQAIKSSAGPGKDLPVLTTRGYTEGIEDAIDIWCGSIVTAKEKQGADQQGKATWFYNGYPPCSGAVILEASAIDLRVNGGWLKWRYGLDNYFLWHGTHWKHNHQGPRGRWNQNVFSYPVTFMLHRAGWDMFYGEGGMYWGNGDGMLFYPGRDPYFMEQDRGIDGPISSIRMKNLRRGIQDYEYMWLAAERAGKAAVDAVVESAIPRGLHEADPAEQAMWSSSGSDWDGHRDRLAELILGGGS